MQYPPPAPTECRFCDGPVSAVPQSTIYGVDFDGRRVFVCEDCGARVGTHPDGTPLGTLADEELRNLRKAVHRHLDPLYEEKERTRQQAYGFLFGNMMGLPAERRHVAMLNKGECRTALSILTN